ncbi:glycoside hydrolase family 43 protein [Spirosoma harenae]
MKYTSVLLFVFLHWVGGAFVKAQVVKNPTPVAPGQGGVWTDTDGKFINAHGGGMLQHNGTYYWFGEIKKGKTWLVPGQDWECYRVPAGGISCYSSTDLKTWKFEGVVLSATTNNRKSDLDTSHVIERPKVVYNQKTKLFVMWVHIDHNDYSYAHAGVAVSTNPTGPYRYLRSIKPNGHDSRDMTVFQDDDGKAYLIHSSEANNTILITLLSDDYLRATPTYVRALKNKRREAPAVFKHAGKYYMITSDCTGWSPSPAAVAVADSPLGDWELHDNPCVGPNAETTFQSQSTYVLPLDAKRGKFLFMADRWNKSNLEDSRYLWLPMTVTPEKVEIKWQVNRP